MNTAFNAIKITEHVYWVGAIDSELRDFHGYNTSRGTTYNAYLILGDTPVLIDTVKAPFYDEMMARIASVIEPQKIEYIISNHAEMDHSGCLPQAVNMIKPKQVFASSMGAVALKDHLHCGFSITPINNEAELVLGNAHFKFLETRMLHWPDSMFTFYTDDGILFSQDAFGMHLATHQLFATVHDREILQTEAAKYYANILLPYSPLVLKLLEKFHILNWSLKMIAPDHGPIWSTKQEIEWIINLWQAWAQQQKTNRAIIVYDTMWHSTAVMAKAVAEGITDNQAVAQLFPLAGSHRSDIATAILTAKAFVIGSPTINQQMFPTIADTLCYLKGLKPKNLIGQAFGSYGWGGEALPLLQKELSAMQVKLIGEPVAVKYVPTTDGLALCYQLGRQIALAIQEECRGGHIYPPK